MTSATLNGISALFAISAALLWFCSARVKIPTKFPITVTSDKTIGDTRIGGVVASSGSSKEINNMAKALIRQSNLSAAAAISAGIAAILQALAQYIS